MGWYPQEQAGHYSINHDIFFFCVGKHGWNIVQLLEWSSWAAKELLVLVDSTIFPFCLQAAKIYIIFISQYMHCFGWGVGLVT